MRRLLVILLRLVNLRTERAERSLLLPHVKLPQVLAYLPLQRLELGVFPAHHTLHG